MASRTAIVLGGAGFIGSTLAERLLAGGWHTVVVDAFEPYYDRSIKERNLKAAMGHPRFRLVEADTRDDVAISSAIRAAAPEVVIDLAARAGVRPSLAQPQLYIDINVMGLQNTLQAVTQAGARFIYASSSSVYGNDDRQPFTEDQMRCKPESPYGATKVAGEAMVHAHHATTGLQVGIARLFTVYGPRQRPDLAIHRFAVRMLEGAPVDLYDQGRGLRDYTYVDDIVDAFVRLIHVDDPSLTVNLGSHRPVRTSDVVDSLERALGLTAERRWLPAQPGDVSATFADIGRAAERLGWKPAWDFDDGIAAFCAWLRGSRSA